MSVSHQTPPWQCWVSLGGGKQGAEGTEGLRLGNGSKRARASPQEQIQQREVEAVQGGPRRAFHSLRACAVTPLDGVLRFREDPTVCGWWTLCERLYTFFLLNS